MALLKKIFSFFILTFTLSSYELDIKQLQHNFYQDVLIQNLYYKRFSQHLAQACPLYKENCYKKVIKKLQAKYSIVEDRQLRELYRLKIINTLPQDDYLKKAKSYLNKHSHHFENSQFVSFIDLSKQLFVLFLFEEKKHFFHYVGQDSISAGNIQREQEVLPGEDHYFKTPSGLFEIQSGWRSKGEVYADGTTLPYGQKDRFVFYFGKQFSVRYNTFDSKGRKLKDKKQWTLIKDQLSFAMHAHQSSNRLGKPYSHGCIRISNELNTFLDNHMVLHKKVLQAKQWISKSAQVPKNPKHHDLAGSYLVVVDKLPI